MSLAAAVSMLPPPPPHPFYVCLHSVARIHCKFGGHQCALMCLQQVGTIHAAAFSDANLYAEVANKAFFWMQPSFYNIDITCLHKEAAAGYFTQVCSPSLPHHLLV